MMAKMSSDLHGAEIKLKTTRPIIVENDINMRITLELSTADGQF